MERNHDQYKSGFIALVGRPNVGKSTLLNTLIGQKVAIMSDKPQTTRNRILAVLTQNDCQMIFIDTPGIHKPKHKMGQIMVDTSVKTLQEVDVVLLLVEATNLPGTGDQFIINNIINKDSVVFLVINKIDLIEKKDILPLIDVYRKAYNFNEIIPISALNHDNVDLLINEIKKYLPEGPQFYPEDMLVDKPERFIMAELIREKVLNLTREEIPHSVAVIVEMVKERAQDQVYVSAVIYVERESQKGIVIGKNGALLKQVGQEARLEIENLLGSQIYLELWVKVKKDWRNRLDLLRNFGLIEVE